MYKAACNWKFVSRPMHLGEITTTYELFFRTFFTNFFRIQSQKFSRLRREKKGKMSVAQSWLLLLKNRAFGAEKRSEFKSIN